MAKNDIRYIKVVGSVQGDADVKKFARTLNDLSGSVKKVSGDMGSLKTMAQSVLGAQLFGFGAREIMGMADSMIQLGSKLNIFVGEGQKAKDALESLAQIAKDTRAPLEGISTIFIRLATATQRLGLSTDTQLKLTRILQQSFRLSGATAAEATAATIQFAQALSFGQLRGQELRSVLSQNSTLATIFGKAIEGSGKDIYKFAEAGGFTSKFVLKTLMENAEDLEVKAAKLSQTFEQSLTKATNEVVLAFKNLNEQFDLNGKFAKGIDFLIANIDNLKVALIGVAAFAIPKVVISLGAMFGAISGFLLTPAGLVATALSVLVVGFVKLSGGIDEAVLNIKIFGTYLDEMQARTRASGEDIMRDLFGDKTNTLTKRIQEIRRIRDEYRSLRDYSKDNGMNPYDEVKLMKKSSSPALPDTPDAKEIATIKEQIGALNSRFNQGKISVTEYLKKLEGLQKTDLSTRLNKGEISLRKFNEEMRDNQVERYSLALENNIITMEQFNRVVADNKIADLRDKYNQGKISLQQMEDGIRSANAAAMDQNTIMAGIADSSQKYIQSVGTFAEQVSGVVTSAMQSFEEAIFQALKKGGMDWKAFTQTVLDEITKMLIKMYIVNNIMKAMGGLFGGSKTQVMAGDNSGSSLFTAANGAAFDGGVQKFAKGGVVSSPTLFGMAGAKTGLMGEAGPEAIVPLKRTSDGALGVRTSPTYINVINNSATDVMVQEKQNQDGSKSIDFIINAKVKEGLASGIFDRQMQQAYGLKRKGN